MRMLLPSRLRSNLPEDAMITRFSCKNFKNITTSGVNFKKINILIGPNNAGKTNFIKALSFLAEMLIFGRENSYKSSFLQTISHNGWERVLDKHVAHKEREIDLSWNIQLENCGFTYKFSFNVGKDAQQDFFITCEDLENIDKPSHEERPFNYFSCHTRVNGVGEFSTATKKGQWNKRKTINVSNMDTVLLQLQDILFKNPNLYKNDVLRTNTVPFLEKIENYFKNFYFYSSASFNMAQLRVPQDIKRQGITLEKDGSNFVNVFNEYKASNIFFKNTFDEKLHELIPNLKLTDVVIKHDKLAFMLGLNDNTQYDLEDISDGTLKAMLLIMLIYLPINQGYSLLAIDEPEMNLHPAWQKALGKWIQLSSNFKQCFISTHSPDFLDVFTDGFRNGSVAIFVFDPKADTLVKELSYKVIQEDLEGWELGDLYRVNEPALGGWPW